MSLKTLETDLYCVLQKAINEGFEVIVKDGIIRIQDPADGGKSTRYEINFTVPKLEKFK